MLDTLRCPHCLFEHLEDYSFYETKIDLGPELGGIGLIKIINSITYCNNCTEPAPGLRQNKSFQVALLFFSVVDRH